jgi:hypothetical protein
MIAVRVDLCAPQLGGTIDHHAVVTRLELGMLAGAAWPADHRLAAGIQAG